MGKLNPIKVRRALDRIEHKRRAKQRDAYAQITTAPHLEHVYHNRTLRAPLEMELKSPRIKIPQTNCLYNPKPKRFRSLK